MNKSAVIFILILMVGISLVAASNIVDLKDILKVSLYDGEGNPIGSLKGAINIHDADVHTRLINRHFIDFDSAIENPNVVIICGNTSILVDDTTGFTVGDHVVLKNPNDDVLEHHFDITVISTNTSITLDRPIDNNYTINATLEKVDLNMASVAGTLTSPIIYEIAPPEDEVWHIERILISITDQSAMDDALFGGIARLANGVVIKEVSEECPQKTISNWKANSDMKEDMFDVEYSSKAPAGFYGLSGRFTFENAGAIIRLDGSLNETLEILIQDDLTDLDSFRIKAQGHFEGE